MAFPVINLIADAFFSVFGSGVIMALVIFGGLIMILLALRANLEVILVILIPLAIGLVLNVAGSNFIDFPAWILIVLFMIAGFMFSLFFLWFIK